MKRTILYIIFSLVFISCEKEEGLPAAPTSSSPATSSNSLASIEATCSKLSGSGSSAVYSPLSGVSVNLYKSYADISAGKVLYSSTTGASGKVIFSSLTQSSYYVKATFNSRSLTQSVNTPPKTKSFVNLDF